MLRNYYAAYESAAEFEDETLLDVLDFRLISFFQMKSGLNDEFFFGQDRRHASIILDSGAFSAWTQKTEISFRDYLKYCRKHAGRIDYFVNLDRIPHVRSEEEAQRKTAQVMGAVEGGYRNYRQMVAELAEVGVEKERIIHVYHQFEPIEVLRKMVDHDRMDYVGLSHCTFVSPKKKHEFFKRCFDEVILNEHGQPKCKTHAFGLTMTDLLSKFPFYSADARAWGASASKNVIYVPKFRDDVNSHYGDPLEFRWDFSKLEKYDVGNLTKKKDFWLNKRLDTRQKTGSYRMSLIAYIIDVDREYPFPIVDGQKFWVGESKLHRKSNRETLGPREREINPNSKLFEKLEQINGKIGPSNMLTEEIIEYGLVHNLQWRMKINILGLNYFVRQLDPVGYDAFQASKRALPNATQVRQ